MPDIIKAAGVAFVTPGGRALFVKRGPDSDHAGEWCFPSGVIEPGETAAEAALREAREEVGFDQSTDLRLIKRNTSGENVDFSTLLSKVAAPFDAKLNHEHTEAVWASLLDPPQPLHAGVKDVLPKLKAQASEGTATNSFAVSVMDLLKKNFPNLTIETDPLYGAVSAQNPQGVAVGNTVQLIAKTVEGQQIGYCAFSEKMRAHPIVRGTSSQKKKVTGGTWGAVIRLPAAVAQMVGV